MEFTTATTTLMVGDDEDSSSSREDDYEDYEDAEPPSALNYGIPIAIMIVIVFSLCTIVIYTKIRKRRQREAGVRRDTAPNVSGGVAMNVNVYRNYGVYVNNTTGGGGVGVGGIGGGGPHSPPDPYIADQPPSYDDVIKESRTEGIQNNSFQADDESPDVESPPPYTPDTHGAPGHSQGHPSHSQGHSGHSQGRSGYSQGRSGHSQGHSGHTGDAEVSADSSAINNNSPSTAVTVTSPSNGDTT